MSAQDDRDLLVDRRCTNIKTVICGGASLVHGYQRDTKKRLYCMRYADKVTRFHLPAKASSHARREGLWQRQTGMLKVCPEGALDLIGLLREANKGTPLPS
jgi:hypothetical protein